MWLHCKLSCWPTLLVCCRNYNLHKRTSGSKNRYTGKVFDSFNDRDCGQYNDFGFVYILCILWCRTNFRLNDCNYMEFTYFYIPSSCHQQLVLLYNTKFVEKCWVLRCVPSLAEPVFFFNTFSAVLESSESNSISLPPLWLKLGHLPMLFIIQLMHTIEYHNQISKLCQ